MVVDSWMQHTCKLCEEEASRNNKSCYEPLFLRNINSPHDVFLDNGGLCGETGLNGGDEEGKIE